MGLPPGKRRDEEEGENHSGMYFCFRHPHASPTRTTSLVEPQQRDNPGTPLYRFQRAMAAASIPSAVRFPASFPGVTLTHTRRMTPACGPCPTSHAPYSSSFDSAGPSHAGAHSVPGGGALLPGSLCPSSRFQIPPHPRHRGDFGLRRGGASPRPRHRSVFRDVAGVLGEARSLAAAEAASRSPLRESRNISVELWIRGFGRKDTLFLLRARCRQVYCGAIESHRQRKLISSGRG